MKTKPAFESTVCKSCGGTGEFGYRSIYGKACFKCSGIGYKFTKRGRAASDYFVRLMSKRPADVQVGDKIRMLGFNAGSYSQPTYWHKVIAVKHDQPSNASSLVDGVMVPNPNVSIIECEGAVIHAYPDEWLRVAQTAEQKAAALAKALEFQASLTKKGEARRAA